MPLPGSDRGKDRWSAPEPTAGKVSVLSAGPPPAVLVPLGSLGWWPAVVGAPTTGVVLAPAGGTARKESVISQGGTPVFGRVPPSSDLPASGFPASCFAVLGFAVPGLAVEGNAPRVSG